MKPFYALAAALLVCATALSADITIDGPYEAEVGNEVALRIQGTPPLDLAKPLVDQLDWLMGPERMVAYLASPGKPLEPLEVRGELVFGAAGATMQPLVRIQPDAAGEYRLLIDWNQGSNQLVEHMIAVEGDDRPDPRPDPDPDPDPVPPGDRFVLVISETHTRTPGEAAVIQTLRRHLEEAGQWYRIADPDQRSGWLQGYIGEANRREVALPVLMVTVPPTDQHDGAYLVVETLPGRAQEAIAIVEEALAK